MPDRAALIYTYDGSFDGLLCCVFESFLKKELPMGVEPQDEAAPTLYPQRFIEADREKALRVQRGVLAKMGADALLMLRTAFLYGEEGRDMAVLDFLRFGLTEGGKRTAAMVDRPEVSPLFKMYRAVGYEAHLLKGFTRFADCGGALSAVITPKHCVLPLLKGHFSLRYRNEDFMIFDKTHHAALVHAADGRVNIAPVEDVQIPDEAEQGNAMYQRLWKEYYKNIAIKERENPKCRMTHMPKRFWPNMLEVADELSGGNGIPKQNMLTTG